MTTPAALAIELELDRAEASLLSGDSDWLATAGATRLADRALAADEPALRIRGRVLTRWSLAARLAAVPEVRAAHAAPRDLPGLARRHAALGSAATRLGFAATPALFDAIHGACNTPTPQPQDDARPAWPAHDGPVPDAGGLVAALAARHGLDLTGIDLRTGAATSATATVCPGHARISIGPAGDDLARLALTLHESGHALYRAQQRGMSLLAAAPPARWFDEAIAAWSVRALEDPSLVSDGAVRTAATARRAHREHVTARLAAFEAAAFAHHDITAAWHRTGLRDPAAYPALFDEPGVMASYAAADRAHLAAGPGDLTQWARAGASLDPSRIPPRLP